MAKLHVKFWTLLVALCTGIAFGGCKQHVAEADYHVIPLPTEIALEKEAPFELTETSIIFYAEADSLKREAKFLAEYLTELMDVELQLRPMVQKTAAGLYLVIDTNACSSPESYRIDISSNKIVIRGADRAGVFYGVQTLRKSMPAGEDADIVRFPAGTVSACPQFAYRGMHLDVSRHFIPIDSVKRYLDMMALHQINKFHLHLTDDQGWRMEIKRYPELTYTGAWRSGTVLGRNTNSYDTIRHGGFYTQEQLRDLVAYAAERHITIIPEIDLPGHMQAALAACPAFGCTGGPYEVWRRWGVSDEVICAGNETAMRFLEDVLNEVMDVFPSDIIHIGGDECPKTRWKECPKCQAKIQQLGLHGDSKFSAEDYLQSYVMNRMEKTVKARGRRIIGWDEILEGNISKSAMIMSWRGTSGGITAAKKGHDVVMAPGDYLYFSQGQSLTPEEEPVAADGYLPVERVYSFRPLPDELNERQKKHIIGLQACLWGEYVHSYRDVEYDALPRMAALAELQWCKPQQYDYQDFVKRCFKMAKLYDACGYHYARHIFDLQAEVVPDYDEGCITVSLSKFGDGEIRYSLDGSNPKRGEVYTQPVEIRENTDFHAILIRPDGETSEYKTQFRFSKSSMKPITLKEQPHENYAYAGAPTLIDGLHGSTNYRTGRWIGFWGTPLEATIDLLQPTDIQKVSFHTILNINDWIYNPQSVTVSVSEDGENFREVAMKEYPLAAWGSDSAIEDYALGFKTLTTRYLRVRITGHQLPEGHTGHGFPAWVFVDEIEVE